jgi:phytoene/squalene synthetase
MKNKIKDSAYGIDFAGIYSATNSRLAVAASLWDPERISAFKTCYKSMRMMDDLVDDRKEKETPITPKEKEYLTSELNNWVHAINERTPKNKLQKKLISTLDKFKIPTYLWENLAESMIYDLDHNGFETFDNFLKYSEGAAVSPGAVGMHLGAISKNGEGYLPPKFDILESSRSLARFCYITHIMRDFQEDQNKNLNYFSNDRIEKSGLSTSSLKEIAASGKINSGFREMMGMYYKDGEKYQKESRDMINKISKDMEPKYHLSLELILDLYSQVFERIDVDKGSFSTSELNPTPKEIETQVRKTISNFNR